MDMKNVLREFYSEMGSLSWMRGIATLPVVTGCYAILHQLWFWNTVDFLGATGVIAVGLGAKAVQKHTENKYGKAD